MIKVVSVEDSGYYNGEHTSGSTVKVTLQRDKEFVSCTDIVIWDEEAELEDGGDYLFDDWKEFAQAGEEGFAYWQAA